MTTTDYNGWTNYETWCVNLWLSNDEPLYRCTADMAAIYAADEAHVFADVLAEFIDDVAEQTCTGSREGASFVVDLLSAALSEVNWHEIAEHWIHDAREMAA